MIAPGEQQFGAASASSGPGLGLSASPRVAAFAAAIAALLSATDEIADAVRRHDHDDLVKANARAESLLGEVGRRGAALGPDDRIELEWCGVPGLFESLRTATRRNAHLIEHAWAVDAALIRLLAGLGRAAPESGASQGVSQYGAVSAPAYVDRQA